jgi:RHS repeat-associated protein
MRGAEDGMQVSLPAIKPGLAVLTACMTLLGVLLPPPVEAAGPVVSPSGAGTVVIGPQAMEGNLQIHPGDALRAGFDFTMPGSHPAATASFYNGSIALLVTCANGATPALAINLAAQTLADPAGSPSWYPSGDQSSSLVFQGTLTAPDLCGGGVMNDANGATFTTTFFSTDTIDKVNFRFHYSDNTAGSWSATVQGTPTPFAKTVTSATLTPALSLGLTTDHTTAIPGDTISYTATVTNTGSTLAVSGDFVASATGSASAIVASYWDDVSTSPDGTTWTPLAGSAGAQSGYTPAVAAPITSGMVLAATAVAATGVTYPTSGDRILSTSISAGNTATWHYAARVPLTPTQAATLVDPTKVKKVRNSFHLEVSPANPNVTQPAIINVDFSTLFFGAGPSASVSNVKVTVQPPQNASPLVFSSDNTPALATLAPGASAPVTATFQVPVPAAKGTQTDSSYFTSLSAVEGTVLTTSATASGTAPAGTISATSPPNVSTTEHLPIVSIAKSGPTVINAGDTETNPLAIKNNGGAIAASLSVIDAVTGGGSGTVTGVPASLAAGASATASATYPVPTSQPSGGLTDTASVTWTDANGNSYGSLSSSFTTQVQNILFGATLTLAPANAGPNVPGTTQQLVATLVDSHGNPIPNQLVHFTVTGGNPGAGTATTDANGNASFTFAGTNPGTDSVQATVTGPGITITSNVSTVSWLKQLQPVAPAAIQGNFYANAANSCTFDIGPSATAVFGQTFPDILFNPASTVVPHDISTVGNFTRPFTDLTVDVNGNYNGQIVAQGNGQQAGAGSLINFYGVFSGTFVINQPGDLTFRILHDDGYIIGVGGGATRVNGDFEGNPPATTPFNNYGVVAAWNTGSSGSSSSGPATVHFPAAGTYPFELDYTECGAGALFLNLLTEQFVAQTNPLSVYVGYADALRAGGSAFPFPWDGSPNTNFFGCPGCPYDAGAIRFDNNSQGPMTFDSITVDVGANHYDLWPHALTLAAGKILILTMTVNDNFDTSDVPGTPCNVNNGVIPKVNVTIAGTSTSYPDVGQVLNTGGFDLACLRNESLPWRSINGAANAINLPVPPAASLNLTPFNIPGATQGQSVSLTVSALDGAGNPAVNLPVTMQVLGANTQTLNGTTGTNGLATFTYLGVLAGPDSVQASAFVGGLRAISNQGLVVWTPPGGATNPLGPSISSPTPADGSVVTKPVAVTATIAPPSGQTIASWRVFYQALDPGSPVTINSGTGTPPSALATFDPTVLPNDTYGITVEATATSGAVQELTTTVTVLGNLKPGRYTTTYQDLAVPVGGFQMEVRRTYDSIDPSNGDFGVGWRVSVSNFRTAPNRVLGAAGWVQYNKSCTLGLCFTAFKNSAPRFVTVTFPDQHTETFDFTPTGGTNLFWECGPAFTGRQGTQLGSSTSTLVALDDTGCSYSGDGNIYGSGGGPYNPHRFKLTTRDGRQLVLDRTLGLISETDSNGNSLTINNSGVHSVIGPASSPTNGPSISFARDGSSRITDVNGPIGGQHIHYVYGGNELTEVTDPNGNTLTYTYDPVTGKLKRSNDPNNQPLQTLSYDSGGRLVSIANGNQPPTIISTNVGAQQQTVLDPNGQLTTVLTYDDLGDVTQEDNVFNGRTLTSHFSFDAIGRPTGTVDPLGHSSGITYDESPSSANGNVLTVFANGRTWSLENYNGFGEPGLIREPDNSVLMALTYDPVTAAVTSTQAPGHPQTQFVYWPDGQLKSFTDPGGRSVNFAYDPNGNLASISDSLGRATKLSIDAAGLVRSVTDQIGIVTKFDYYPDGSLQAVTDGNLNKSQYFYDSLMRLHQAKDGLGHSTFYDYNDVGLVKQRTDRNAVVTSYSYDADGVLTQEARPNNDLTTFSHDPLGQIIGANNTSGHVDRTYDDAGRLTSETSCAGTGGPTTPCSAAPGGGQPHVTLSYDYYSDDQLKTVTSSDAAVPAIQFAYEAVGRLASIQYGAQAPFSMRYDALGRPSTLARPNGITDTFVYSSSGDLTARDASLNGTVLARFDYGIDPVTGQRTSLTDNTGVQSFSYFDNGWLRSASHPAGSGLGSESYTYDAAGNRSLAGIPSSYDAADRLRSDGTFNYGFDAEGNRVSKTPVGGGPGTTYTWNADNQLLAIAYPDGTSSSYRYDPFGRRIASVDAGNETRYVYDGISIEAVYNSLNQLQTSYLSRLESLSQGHATYYLSDALGTVRTLTDSTGAVVGNSVYNSFGMPASGNATAAQLTFSGYQRESVSGLYYAGARYYDPSTGTFLSEDPLPSTNPYPYAGNDPANLIDLYGMQATAEYAELLSTDSDVAQCVSGEVAAVSGPSLAAAAAALGGGVPTEAGVVGEIAGGLLVNEAQCSASALASKGSRVRKVGGQNPKNYRYAGGVHPSGVRYNEHGFPRFAPYARATVRLEGLTGQMWHDEPLANAAAGYHGTPDGYTWHHVEDCVTMQLLPDAIHEAARHTGGAAMIRAGEC